MHNFASGLRRVKDGARFPPGTLLRLLSILFTSRKKGRVKDVSQYPSRQLVGRSYITGSEWLPNSPGVADDDSWPLALEPDVVTPAAYRSVVTCRVHRTVEVCGAPYPLILSLAPTLTLTLNPTLTLALSYPPPTPNRGGVWRALPGAAHRWASLRATPGE